MCDCREKEEDPDPNRPETVTIFSKCPEHYRPGKDITKKSFSDTVLIRVNRLEPVESDFNSVICDASKYSPIENESSTESSRTYKFLDRSECECRGEPEDDENDLGVTKISVQPCKKHEADSGKAEIEYTLAIIKPEAVISREQIERRIHEEGFEISRTRWLQMSAEQASEFYSDRYGRLNFAHIVGYITSGPIIVHVLAKRNAIDEWRILIGPTKVIEARLYFPDSLRARYGRRGEDFKNALHGSADREQAEREIRFFFPDTITEPLLDGRAIDDYLRSVINPILVEALSLCCKLKPADPVLWLANWLLLNNPNKPKLSDDLALIPS